MGLDVILWGVAGYIAFFIFQLTQPIRQRSGWDFFLQVSVFSLASFVLARFFIVVASMMFPSLNEVGYWWHNQFHYYFHSLTLIVGMVVASPFIGITLALPRIKHTLHSLLSKIAKISGRHRNFKFTDLFFAYSDKLLGELAMITLKNNKVYIGVLASVTEDPNESQRYLQISPVASGYRHKDTHQLVLTTNYVEDVEQPEQSPNRDILIPASEVITFTRFDTALHERFVKLGLTKVEPTPSLMA